MGDLLRGDYKQSEYGKVILPMVVLRATLPTETGRDKEGFQEHEMPGLPWEELIPFTHPHDDSLEVRWSTGSVQVGIVACVACTNSSAVEQDEDRT